jgi:hypothetical protein
VSRPEKQLLRCRVCDRVFHRDAFPAAQALRRPLPAHPDRTRPQQDCPGSGAVGLAIGIRPPPDGALPE